MRARPAPPPQSGGPTDGALALLLRARRFAVSRDAETVRENLTTFGAELGNDAPVWIGRGRPPSGLPTLSLGEHEGTLGPLSGGFVNVLDQIVAWHAPLAKLPRKGKLAIVVALADDLPDVVVLAAQRELGISWVVSTGAGDPTAVLRFLNADRATDAILFAPSPDIDGRGLRAVIGAKPIALFGGSPLVQAMVRRGGGTVTDKLIDWWLAGELLREPRFAAPDARLGLLGGGAGFVRKTLADAGLARELHTIDSARELSAWVDAGPPAIVLHTGPLPVDGALRDRTLCLDWSSGEVLPALATLLHERNRAPVAAPLVTIDRVLRDRVREEIDVELDDHEAKRLLKAYGARVTRQAPTNTPTGATKLARTIGLPVTLGRQGQERVCATLPEVKQQAALLLDLPPDEREQRLRLPASVMVRERVADAPRSRLRITFDRELGGVVRVGNELGILPLDASECLRLASATLARRAADQAQVGALLYVIARAAVEERVAFDLELFVGAEPMVVKADGRKRPPSGGEPEDEP